MDDNEQDQPFNVNRDQLSTPSLHNISRKTDLKKILLIGGVIVLILLILIILVIVVSNKDSNNNSKDDSQNKEENPEQADEEKKIGEINCIFDTSKKTRILSKEFKTQDIAIYVDKKKVIFTREYDFENFGIHHVTFLIFSDLNMDYMFKDIPELLSVEMISNKTVKVTSMISAFENAENMVNFKIQGFNTSSVTSMNRLFKGTKFTEIDTKGLDSNNVIDMSYMFSECSKIYNLDLSNYTITLKKKN